MESTGSEIKQELIKRGEAMKNMKGKEKKDAEKQFMKASALVQKVSKERAKDEAGLDLKKEVIDLYAKVKK